MLPALLWTRPLAKLLGGNASEALLEYTVSYLRIIAFAVPFSLFSTTVYNQFRLCGNVKDAMAGYMSGMVLNVILDPIFILGLHMGIAGAGLATALGQILSAVLLCLLSRKHGNIPVTLRKAAWGNKRLYGILAGGAPNFSRQGITSIAGVLLNLAAAKYGEVLIAALTVSSRAAAIGYMLAIGFGQGFQPICAMNYGAKKYERVRKAFRTTLLTGTCMVVAFTLLYLIFAERITGMLSSNAEVITLAAKILRYQCISLPFMGFYAFSSMYMQNVGQYFRALLISIMRQGIFYLPLLFILPAVLGPTGLCILQPAADLLSVAGAAFVLKATKIYPEQIMT